MYSFMFFVAWFLGLPQAKVAPQFKDLTVEKGFYTSKDFLPLVSMGSKAGKV